MRKQLNLEQPTDAWRTARIAEIQAILIKIEADDRFLRVATVVARKQLGFIIKKRVQLKEFAEDSIRNVIVAILAALKRGKSKLLLPSEIHDDEPLEQQVRAYVMASVQNRLSRQMKRWQVTDESGQTAARPRLNIDNLIEPRASNDETQGHRSASEMIRETYTSPENNGSDALFEERISGVLTDLGFSSNEVEILQLRLDEKTWKEVGQLLGKNADACRKVISRAVTRLKLSSIDLEKLGERME